ncbi:MAG: PKD domain-containing protein [Candidatus Sulfotelmatobacter sp.]|jgi:alpha-galactosidase
MPTRTRRQVSEVGLAVIAGILMVALPGAAQQLTNDQLSLTVNAQEGSYQLSSSSSLHDGQPVLKSRVAAQVDHQWLRSSDYPRHQASESSFQDDLGSGPQVTVTCSGLSGKPDLVYVLRLYKQRAYGTVLVKVQNSAGREVTVQAIRSVEAMGEPIVNLGGGQSADRVLSDSFSEDWPDLALYDLGEAPGGMHRGAGSQLIYNRESKQSLFFGALTSDRFLTLMHLKAEGKGAKTKIASFTVESTGTTEVQKDFDLQDSPADDQVELSLPLKPGEDISSERLMFEAGPDYHDQLLAYGDAVRRWRHARVSSETPIGWWSWTVYYGAINEGEVLSNGDWQAEHLKSLGYKYFQIDEGYQYARGEFATPNATQFPDGLRFVGHHLTGEGLTFGIWTAPFEVTSRAWVYEHHKDWLVHNAKGDPIPLGEVWDQKTDVLYALDTTHPGAQQYMRDTYRKLVREWGVRFIKLDFMDTTAIEGYHYRPNTTALEAQRIGLQVIRDAVGEEVILDKDGSPMLNPVGLVDTGRISADTGHSFERTKNAASGIAARFYMQRNFFVNDPDAFNVTATHLMERANEQSTISLGAAEASIALSAVSGGMYEIGDDMLILGAEKDRLALVENRELLNMAKVGRASKPLDLMTYEPEDGQPSIFFLREDQRQAILTVFNWTNTVRSHTLRLADLGLPAGHTFAATDVLNENETIAIGDGAVRLENQPPQSVRVIKLIDTSVAAAAPTVTAQVPTAAKAGETIILSADILSANTLSALSAQAETGGVPAVAYHWDFGDGTSADSAKVSHAYTSAGEFTIQLTVDGVDGVPAHKNFSVKVTGNLRAHSNLTDNRRFVEPTDR